MMAHEEYVRLVPGADTAALFIHGIVGTPNHFRDVIPLLELVPENWSVYNVLLDGHGKTVDDFASSSMKKWRSQVWNVFDRLCESHHKIVIVAHSMGALFAMQLAREHPEKVSFLFLLAAPMRTAVRLSGIRSLLRLVFGKLREDAPQDASTIKACGVQTTRNLWKYVKWIPRFLELFRQIYLTEQKIGELTVPCVVFQSEKDEYVLRSARNVLEKSMETVVHDLPNSTHFYYHSEDQKFIMAEFLKRCKKVTHD